jgi:sec-independent protein translocase protein TatA
VFALVFSFSIPSVSVEQAPVRALLFLNEVVMAGISVWQLAIIAAIVVLLFGTKKLSRIGGDLGTSIKGFKHAMQDKPNDET